MQYDALITGQDDKAVVRELALTFRELLRAEIFLECCDIGIQPGCVLPFRHLGKQLLLLAANMEEPWFMQKSLTLLQLRAIEVVALTAPKEFPELADDHRNRIVSVLRDFGLPTDLNELRRFLGYEIIT